MAAKSKALRSAPSFESCASAVFLNTSSSFNYKANGNEASVAGYIVSSPAETSGSYSCDGNSDQGFGSSVKDIDLVALDSLEDDQVECGQNSICSSSQSEDWHFQPGSGGRKHNTPDRGMDIEDELQSISSSPTKTGDFVPRPLPPRCLVASTAYQYGFSPLVVSVGTTYFQRLAAADPVLKGAAQSCPDFAAFVEGIPDMPSKVSKSVGAPLHQCQTVRHWLLAVHLTCIYVAAKNVEMVPYKHLLRTMLQRLHGLMVTPEQVERLEMEVLVALDWRLGPFFLNRDC